jgi:hypothetical protein
MGTRRVERLVLGVACAVLVGGCEVLLDFKAHPDAGPADAAPVDAMLVPDPCTVLEPNNDPTTAIALVTGENRYAAICPAGDVDYYKVSTVAGQSIDFKILFKNANGDLDLQLYDMTGMGLPLAESRGFDDNEEIKCPNDAGMMPSCAQLAAGDYIFKVFPAVPGGTQNVYRLDVTIAP